jgi:hypothetical protein
MTRGPKTKSYRVKPQIGCTRIWSALGIDVWAHRYDFPTRGHAAAGYLAGANPGIEIMVLSSLRVLSGNRILIMPLRRCLLPFWTPHVLDKLGGAIEADRA